MENALRNWLTKNKIISVNVKKGSESVYKTDGIDSEDLAEQLAESLENLPSGNYRILGREKIGTNWDNAQTYTFEKKSTQSIPHSGMGMISQEQFQIQMELERKKWEFELLKEKYDKLENRVEKLEERFGKMADAVKELVDDDESNDQSGLQKITELASTAKNLFSDIKI